MKAGWEKIRLLDAVHVYQPKTIAKRHLNIDGKFPVYGANGKIGFHSEYNHEEPQLLLGCRGSVGSLHMSEPQSWINGNAMVVEVSKQIDREFVRYRLMDKGLLDDAISGTAQPQITRKSLNSITITLPPLNEQKRIVAVLDAAFAGIDQARENVEANLADAETLKSSAIRIYIENVSNSPNCAIVSLGQLCKIYQPKTISKKQMTDDGKYIVFGANGPIGRYDRYNHEDAEILVTCRGATCGTVNVSDPFSWITGNSMVLRPKSHNLTKSYLKNYLEYAMDFKGVITGSAQPQITRKSLSPAKIVLPALNAQYEVVSFVEAFDQYYEPARKAYEGQLAHLDALRQSLLERAFAGELT